MISSIRRASGTERTRRTVRNGAAVALALVTAGGLAACGGDSGGSGGSGDTIKVGFITDLAGVCAGPGKGQYDGVKDSVEAVNKTGIKIGDKTYKVELVTRSGDGDNTKTVAALQSLINDEGVKYVVGPGCGAQTSPGIGPVAIKAGIVMINQFPYTEMLDPAKTADVAKNDGKLLFATQPTPYDSGYAQAGAAKALPSYDSIKNVTVMLQNDSGGQLFAGALGKWYEDNGMTVNNVTYDVETQDFTGVLSKVKATNPDLLVYGYFPDPSLAILKQSLALDVADNYYGFGADSRDYLERATGGPIDKPAVFLPFPKNLAYSTTPGAAAYAKQYAAELGKDVTALDGNDSYAATLYDAVPMLAQAWATAGTVTDLEKVANVIATQSYTGVLGDDIKFDEGHHLLFQGDGCLVLDGKISCLPVQY